MKKNGLNFRTSGKEDVLKIFATDSILSLPNNQKTIPELARNNSIISDIKSILPSLPTYHHFYNADARRMSFLAKESVHLILTSPPYWTLKKYNDKEGQMGHLDNYRYFIRELNRVWRKCYRSLVPGGRLVCVVGDVCLSRKKNNGRHTVVPLHSTIQESCRTIGYDNLAPIIWNKISNATYEVEGNSSFLGKPYEPNAVIKNDIEFILMERKPGGYRQPSFIERAMSVIPVDEHQKYFSQIWTGIGGASTRKHPAPFPLELASRIIKMFSFVGDTVLDPFWGTGTTSVAAWQLGRNSIGVEIDKDYFQYAINRFYRDTDSLLSNYEVKTISLVS